MKQYIEMPLTKDSKESVTIEVTDQEDTGRVSASSAKPTKVERTFTEVLRQIKPIIATIVTELQDAANGLKEMEVELGVNVNSKASVWIVSGGLDASFKVRMKFPKG